MSQTKVTWKEITDYISRELGARHFMKLITIECQKRKGFQQTISALKRVSTMLLYKQITAALQNKKLKIKKAFNCVLERKYSISSMEKRIARTLLRFEDFPTFCSILLWSISTLLAGCRTNPHRP